MADRCGCVSMLWIGAQSLYKNSQRPGAIVNMTISEVRAAVESQHTDEENTYWIVRVKDHKANITGTAKVVYKNDDIALFRQYLKYVRPKLLSGKTSVLAFPTPSGKPIQNLNQLTHINYSKMADTANKQPITIAAV